MKKRILGVLLVCVMVFSLLTACGKEEEKPASNSGTTNNTTNNATNNDSNTSTNNATSTNESEAPATNTASNGTKVGVAMPTKDLQRWNQDGDNMKKKLEEAGYVVDLQYASNDVPTQVSQIENMISSGCKVLVIASIEGDSLGTVLEQAKEKDVKVIAYDRLIMGSDAVTYYATFDNEMVGTKQGQYIEEKLGLKSGKGPYNIELITGDPGDNNARFFYKGAMDVLQPYIDNGQLVVKSGQIDFATVATQSWSTENAQNRFDAILAANYSDGTQLDAVLASNDSTAMGVTNSLIANYEGTHSNWPIITGDPGDNNARFFYKGAMDVLQPYIDNGQLVVKSGQIDFATVATQSWSTENAQNRFDAIIAANYSDGTQLDAVLASNDSTAMGVTNSLIANYEGTHSNWPIITGQDCDKPNVKNMLDGKQSMSIFKDTRTLAAKTVEMVDAIMQGKEAPINDRETYDNGTGKIPSYLCEPVFADASNYEEILIKSGYYTMDDIK